MYLKTRTLDSVGLNMTLFQMNDGHRIEHS
jgi:hypothetical protein